MKITEQFPPLPLEVLVDRIKNFETATTDDKHKLISDLVNVHPFLSADFSKGHVFRRARKILPDEYPSKVQDLLWNPNLSRIGRVNPEGYSVLYVSDRIETTFSEIHVKDDYVLLSEIEIQEGKKCRIYPIGELIKIQRTGRGFLIGDNSSAVNDMLNACDRESSQSLLITDAFLLECLIKDDDKYLISSYTAKCIFEKNTNISAIAYPSVQQFGALNFAVKTDDFWKNCCVVAARRMKVKDLPLGFYKWSKTEHVNDIDPDGNLNWEKEDFDDLYSHRFTPWYQR